MESLRLEKTSNIIQSNLWPNTTVSTKAWHWHVQLFLEHCQDSTTSLGSPVQCLITLSGKKLFLMANLNLPWHSLGLCPLVLLQFSGRRGHSTPCHSLLSGTCRAERRSLLSFFFFSKPYKSKKTPVGWMTTSTSWMCNLGMHIWGSDTKGKWEVTAWLSWLQDRQGSFPAEG